MQIMLRDFLKNDVKQKHRKRKSFKITFLIASDN